VPKDKVCLSAVPKFAAAMSKLTGKSVATIQADTKSRKTASARRLCLGAPGRDRMRGAYLAFIVHVLAAARGHLRVVRKKVVAPGDTIAKIGVRASRSRATTSQRSTRRSAVASAPKSRRSGWNMSRATALAILSTA
jgi:hypothetical protein